jgi:hypothetical protein
MSTARYECRYRLTDRWAYTRISKHGVTNKLTRDGWNERWDVGENAIKTVFKISRFNHIKRRRKMQHTVKVVDAANFAQSFSSVRCAICTP